MDYSEEKFTKYAELLGKAPRKTAELVTKYIEENGLEDIPGVIDYAYRQTRKYSKASIALNAKMYNEVAELEGLNLKPAELIDTPEYSEVAKTFNGTFKKTTNPKELGASVSRLVKISGERTMVNNARRDRAEVAWIPHGDTCPYCIAMASQGWVPVGTLNGGEHIHPNCDCTYMVRHKSSFNVKGYDPDYYRKLYDEGADVPYENENMSHPKHDWASTAKINGMRRKAYAEKKKKLENMDISSKEKRKILSSSAAEEIKVGG